jgi:hypothetical protein
MNEILLKRIEKAAKEEREQCREDNNEIWRDRPTYNDVEASFIKGATFALQNQWISVEEALPDYNEAVIGIDYMPELAWDDQTIIFVHRSDNPNVVTDKNKFCVYPPTFRKVTHWMPVPEFPKGGK